MRGRVTTDGTIVGWDEASHAGEDASIDHSLLLAHTGHAHSADDSIVAHTRRDLSKSCTVASEYRDGKCIVNELLQDEGTKSSFLKSQRRSGMGHAQGVDVHLLR